MEQRKALQFVVKISKLCNLRCTYCYEFRELGNKEKVGLDRLERFFQNISDYARREGLGLVSFVWHGGEPLLVKPEYYAEIGKLQKAAFGDAIEVWNTAQTNLTTLTDAYVAFLKSKEFFRGIGISFDVYGDQRVDTRGRLRTDTVLKNLQRIIDEGISFGAISVLAKNTLPHVKEIYAFYDGLHIEPRFLPFYRTAFDEQRDDHALTGSQVVDAFKLLFDLWAQSEHATPVEPLDQYLDFALAYIGAERKRVYQKGAQETVFVVNLDGSTWGVSETYDDPYRYGNVFDQPFEDVLASPARQRALAEAEARIEKHCTSCPFFGSCPGYFVGDATVEQRAMLEEFGCPVRKVLEYMVERLEATGMADTLKRSIAEGSVGPYAQQIDF